MVTRALCCKILYFTPSSGHKLTYFDTTFYKLVFIPYTPLQTGDLSEISTIPTDNTNELRKGRYDLMDVLEFDSFGFDKTSKFVVN